MVEITGDSFVGVAVECNLLFKLNRVATYMTDENRHGSFRYTSTETSTACNVAPQDSSADTDVLRRISSGEDGKSNTRVPKFNSYVYTYLDEEVGNISFSTKVRSFTSGPCNDPVLTPFIRTLDRSLTDVHPAASSISAQAIKNCSRTFLDRVSAKQKSIQSIVAGGEMRETFRMLRHPLRSLVDVTTKYVLSATSAQRGSRSSSLTGRRARKGPSIKDTAEALNNSYLEWQFGVKPILADIKGTAKAYYNNRDDYTVVSRVSARVTEEDSSSFDAGPYNPTAGFDGRKIVVDTTTSKYQLITYLTASSPLTPGESPFLRDIGLTTSDFVPSLYELLPWSFVLDYFVDIGGYLNREVAISRNWQVIACRSEHSVSVREVSISGTSYPDPGPSQAGYYGQSYNCTPAVFRTVSGSRSPITIGDLARDPGTSNTVKINLPNWKQSLNIASLASAFVLAKQAHPLTSQQRRIFGI